jgi:hypothetical protein
VATSRRYTPTRAMTAGGTRRALAERGMENGIIAPPRAVERTFAIPNCWYGYRRVRYRSLVRNALQLLRSRSTCAARSRYTPEGHGRNGGAKAAPIAQDRTGSAHPLPVPRQRRNELRHMQSPPSRVDSMPVIWLYRLRQQKSSCQLRSNLPPRNMTAVAGGDSPQGRAAIRREPVGRD